MSDVKIYTTTFCPYCTAAKELLEQKQIPFEEIDLSGREEELAALKQRTGMRTVPQVFIKDELIGGYTELAALNQSGELDSRLS